MESKVFDKLGQITESYFGDIRSIVDGTYVTEANDGDGKIESKEELKAYAMTLAKKAFGDDVDTSKVDGVVDNAIKDSDGDWETAAGIVTGSFNESVEATDEDDSEEEVTEESDVCSDCEKDPCECDKEEVTEEADEDENDSDDEDDDEDEDDKEEDTEDKE